MNVVARPAVSSACIPLPSFGGLRSMIVLTQWYTSQEPLHAVKQFSSGRMIGQIPLAHQVGMLLMLGSSLGRTRSRSAHRLIAEACSGFTLDLRAASVLLSTRADSARRPVVATFGAAPAQAHRGRHADGRPRALPALVRGP